MNIDSVQNMNYSVSNHQSAMKSEKLSDLKFDFRLNAEPNQELKPTDQMEMMLKDIENIKEVIETDLTVENVMKYKEVIASFLKYYTENILTLEDVHTRHPKYGYREKMTIVKKVEDNMRDLDDLMGVLDTKTGHLEMLRQIGEINGLVLNLML